jgi:hypothetical protein
MTGAHRIFPALGAALALAACAAQPAHNESLERARRTVTAAAAEPNVERYARSELESAQDAFASAERSARRGLSPQVTEHWAYLAEQRAAIARERSEPRRRRGPRQPSVPRRCRRPRRPARRSGPPRRPAARP